MNEKGLENVHILFADDSVDTLDLLKLMARGLGWTGDYVTSASGIIDAVNRNCQEGGPCYDAIVADINYFNAGPGPRMTGITAAREIRKVHPNVPIVFISAYSNSLIREEVRRVGAQLVDKPFEFDQLFARVRELVRWHRAALNDTYEGENKRRSSVNKSKQYRRASDRRVEAPDIIKTTLEENRDKEQL